MPQPKKPTSLTKEELQQQLADAKKELQSLKTTVKTLAAQHMADKKQIEPKNLLSRLGLRSPNTTASGSIAVVFFVKELVVDKKFTKQVSRVTGAPYIDYEKMNAHFASLLTEDCVAPLLESLGVYGVLSSEDEIAVDVDLGWDM